MFSTGIKIKSTALLILAGGLLSCSDDGIRDDGGEYIPPDSGVVFIVGSESGSADTAELSFSAPWQLSVPAGGFQVSPESGPEGEVVLTVTAETANGRIGERESSFTITDGTTEALYRIIQKGTPQLVPQTLSVSMSSKVSQTTLAVDGNVSFETSVSADWLEVLSVTASDPVALSDGQTLSDSLRYIVAFQASENTTDAERTAVITLSSETGDVEVSVIQSAPLQVDWSRDFFRASAFLRFTATWCYKCPFMAEAVSAVSEAMPGRVISVNMHSSTSEGGLGYWKVGDYEELYGLVGYPMGVVNNMTVVQNKLNVEVLAEYITEVITEMTESYPAHTGISAYSQLDEDEGKVRVDVSVAAGEEDDYRIIVFLLESGIIYEQENDGITVFDYEHNSVVRAVLTDDIFGDPLPSSGAQEVIEYTIEGDIPRSVLDPANLSVVIAVVRPGHPDIQGIADTQYLDLGYIYDNVVTLPADGFVDLRYEE